MTRKDLGLAPFGPSDVTTVAWTQMLFDTFTPIARVGSVASATALTINTDLYDAFNITALASPIVISAGGTPHDHQKLMIRIKDIGFAQTVTWNAGIKDSGVAHLIAATYPGKTHHVGLIYDIHANKWIALATDPIGY